MESKKEKYQTQYRLLQRTLRIHLQFIIGIDGSPSNKCLGTWSIVRLEGFHKLLIQTSCFILCPLPIEDIHSEQNGKSLITRPISTANPKIATVHTFFFASSSSLCFWKGVFFRALIFSPDTSIGKQKFLVSVQKNIINKEIFQQLTWKEYTFSPFCSVEVFL